MKPTRKRLIRRAIFPYICGPHVDDYDMKGIVHVVP